MGELVTVAYEDCGRRSQRYWVPASTLESMVRICAPGNGGIDIDSIANMAAAERHPLPTSRNAKDGLERNPEPAAIVDLVTGTVTFRKDVLEIYGGRNGM